MTAKDLQILETFLKPRYCQTNEILLCSPSIEQVELMKKYYTKVKEITRNEWDFLNSSEEKHQTIFAANVFHYIPYPYIAFENIFKSCEYLIIQDLIYRPRGKDSEFGTDGDCMRYSLYEDRSEQLTAFDLTIYDSRIIWYDVYNDGDSKHFIALMKGDL